MNSDFVNLTTDNLADEHLCCIIRSKKPHPGVESKRSWLNERLEEGHVFRKLDTKGVVLPRAWFLSSTLRCKPLGCRWRESTIFTSTAYGSPANSRAREGLRQTVDGVLFGQRQSQGKSRCMYVGRKNAEGLALGPGLCREIWV